MERAALLFANGRSPALALEAGTGLAVQPAGWPAGWVATGLSSDGARCVAVSERGRDVLGIVTLATGELRRLPPPKFAEERVAAFSPDGRTLASVVTDDDSVSVDLVDLVTGGREHLWSLTGGGWSAETAICWSPNSRHIAATVVTPDEEWVVVVLRLDDRGLVGLLSNAAQPAGAAFDNDDGLIVGSEYEDDLLRLSLPPTQTSDSSTATARDALHMTRKPHPTGNKAIPLAVVGDRYLVKHDGTLHSTSMHGGDRRPVPGLVDARINAQSVAVVPALLRSLL